MTETKAGPKTTEFMFMVIFIVAVLIATYMDGDDSLGREEGWFYAAIAASAYFISRGLAKLGSPSPTPTRSTPADRQAIPPSTLPVEGGIVDLRT